MRKRYQPKKRRDLIIESSIELSKDIGYLNITRDLVAKKCGVSYSLISRYFNPFQSLKKIIVKKAVEKEILEILSQCILTKEISIKKLPHNLKSKLMGYLTKM